MVPHDDDDKPRKSWRDIDKMRDGSAHRKEPPSSGRARRTERSQAYRSYKSQLNKLFDGGGVPDALKQKLDEAGVGKEARTRKEAASRILDAKTPKEMRAALDTFRAEHGFPDSEDLLTKLLDHPDEGVVQQAVDGLAALLDEGRLKRKSSLKARLKTVQMTMDDPDVQTAAKQLVRRL